ncbi:MAG: hypothetical protein EBY17_28675 [Acidobacteriia bacterium]|nr:hypothetical protein [Terriglobia bacterium]
MNDAEKLKLEELLRQVGPLVNKLADPPAGQTDRVRAAFERVLNEEFPLPKELTEKQMESLLLKLIAEQPADGFELISKLNQGLFRLAGQGEGAIYGVLARLESSGLLQGEWRESSTRMVKMYRLTDAGGLRVAEKSAIQAEIGAWAEMLLKKT